MRKTFAIVLSVLFLAGYSQFARAGKDRTTDQVGDVNGDQTVDLSDAVYLLRAIFSNGPPPAVWAGSDLDSRVARVEERAADTARIVDELAALTMGSEWTDHRGSPDHQWIQLVEFAAGYSPLGLIGYKQNEWTARREHEAIWQSLDAVRLATVGGPITDEDWEEIAEAGHLLERVRRLETSP